MDGVRVLPLDGERVPLSNNAKAGNELSIGEVVWQRSGKADIHVQIGEFILD